MTYSIEYDTLVVVSFKLARRELELLDELADRSNTSRSEIIRRALRYYIADKLAPRTRPIVTRRVTIW